MSRSPRVLVVDDEERNLKLIEAMLIPHKYEVFLSPHGEDALKRVREIDPDVILLDVMMPQIDGFEVAENLKNDEELKTIPVVMVTALNEIDDRVRALEAGADDFLTKPVNITELRARVSSLVKVKAYNDYMKDYQKKLEEEVARRTGQLKRAYEQLKEATFEATYRLTKASEYKDEDTGTHIIRMSKYCAVVARRLGLNDQVVEAIFQAAPMHDVGKIGIPDRILLKPGKLDEKEWAIMKQHTVIGARILEGSDSNLLRMGETIALNHHERWDGTGYPHGIKGRKIPLAARIVSIADVFDALISKRPYKEAFPIEKSLDIIREMNGVNFDPEVVEAFFSSLDEILSVVHRYSDSETESLLYKMNQPLEDVS